MSHTKWEAFTQDSFAGWWAIREVGGAEVGSCDGGFDEKDARLMAAAPTLLEALRRVSVLFSKGIDARLDVVLDDIDAAIAKALGE